MQTVVDMLKAWQPHPFIDHFTVALVIIAVLTDLVASMASSRVWMRYMAVTVMVLAAICAAGSNVTGGWEADRVWDHVTGPAKDVLKWHAQIGGVLPWVIGGLAVWRLGVEFIGFIGGSRPLYLLVALGAAGAICYQGYLGGQLVYTYGVGTVQEAAGASTAAASVTPSPSATPAEATPVPTVYVPPPTPAASVTPAAAEPSPSVANTPVAPVPTVSGALPAPPSPAASPLSTSTPTANPSAAGSGTPVNPPPGEAAPSAAPSGAPTNL